MITPLNPSAGKVLGFKMTGKLHDEDYKHFVPAVEAAVKTHGKVRLLAQFEDFHGWDLHALWDDIKFSTQHCADIERVALVGERKWEEWMAKVCKPFTLAKVKYFDRSEIDAAWKWLLDEA
jgi:SpoIIAA-like